MSRAPFLSILCAAALVSTGALAQTFENASGPVPVAPPGYDEKQYISDCLQSAADAYALPPSLLVLIFHVENGRLGRVSPNASGAPPDVGPFQVNAMWVRKLAERWKTSPREAFLALRDNFCANAEAAAWILRDAIDSSPTDYWRGVAHYHSRTPHFRQRYMTLLRNHGMKLLEQARRSSGTAVTASAE